MTHTITNDYIQEGCESDLGVFVVDEKYKNDKYCNTGDTPNENEVHEFIVLDDDDMVYLRGFSSHSSSFDPIEYEGEEYGCTSIMYKENNDWEYL